MAKAREIEGLDCESDVLEGAQLVLSTRLEELIAFRDAALDFSDIEGVHDMRVASRRLRSALRDFRPYFLEQMPRRRLKEVADALGLVRDEDVAIAELEKLAAGARASVGEETAAGIERITEERRARREGARDALGQAISEEALGELRVRFLARLARSTGAAQTEAEARGDEAKSEETKGDESNAAPAGGRSFRRAAREIIRARFGELRELSGSVYRPFETTPLHDMRIAAKRLRYAIELFCQCAGEHLRPFAKEVAGLQKSLGELHDCDAWIEDLGARLGGKNEDDARAREQSGGAEHRAAVWLLQHFNRERAAHFHDALARWHEWETSDFETRLLDAFDAPPPKDEAGPAEPCAADGADTPAAEEANEQPVASQEAQV